jgi:hypothetical protein
MITTSTRQQPVGRHQHHGITGDQRCGHRRTGHHQQKKHAEDDGRVAAGEPAEPHQPRIRGSNKV